MINLSEIDWDFNVAGSWPLPIKIVAIILASILVVGAGVYYFTLDQLNELDQFELKESELKRSFEHKQMKSANLDDYREQLDQIELHLSDMIKQMPTQAEVANLLIDISQTGLASGLEFRLFKPASAIQRDFYSELPINIKVVGKYEQIGVFVSGLASLPRIVTIHNVSISPTESQEKRTKKPKNEELMGEGILLTMDAVIKTYNEASSSDEEGR
jgi:type IV pilus assembly protein PilO